jgi:glyoxylase-like metal-dependent hydrolase (beta-lactamase superfamily II)
MVSNRIRKPALIYLLLFTVCLYAPAQALTKSVRVIAGPVNGVVLEKNGKRLVIYGDPGNEVKQADLVLFTHFRRDVTWAGRNLVAGGSAAVAPESERSYFTGCDSIWKNMISARFHEYNCQSTKIVTVPLKVSRFVRGGDIIDWQGIKFQVINTPGYTRGSVSYLADIDGKRYAFTGDLIYGDGRIMDLYSLQDSLKTIGGYHGYAVRLGQLIKSLQLIESRKPDFIIPARGPVISDPASAVARLIGKVGAVYRNYLYTSAYRWYYPERMNFLANHVPGSDGKDCGMPYSEVIRKVPPSYYMHIGNTNLVIADDSSAFIIDCGAKSTFEKLVMLRQSGRIKSYEGIFITHYHDDHTNFVNNVVREFGCPAYITRELKEIIENPSAFHMPCLTNDPASNLKIMSDGQQIIWKNFQLTFRFFPGQTLYHDALLFEKKGGEAIFFIGDSFTPSGIDDYCLLNRNLLHPGTGYFYCLDMLRSLPTGVLLANQHVEPLFSFAPEQLDQMVRLMHERVDDLRDLFPWDDLNYGLDEQWSAVYPYGQKVSPNSTVDCEVRLFNHSPSAKTFIVKPELPSGFTAFPGKASLTINPLSEGRQAFKVKIPGMIPAGVYLMTLSIKFDSWDLHEWSEALIEVLP